MVDNKEKSRAYFDAQAGGYNEAARFGHPRECYPYLLEAIEAVPFESALDLGCGPGAVLAQLHERYPQAALTGVDLAANMIAHAREALPAEVALAVGDAEDLPFADASFDLVYCSESFHHYPHPERAVAEVRRVLRPGGSFILCDMYVYAALRPLINVTMPRLSKGGDHHTYSKREIEKLFAAASLSLTEWRILPSHAFICTAVA